MSHLKSTLEVVDFVPRRSKGGFHPSIVTTSHTAVALDKKASGAASRNAVSQKYP